MQCVQCVTPSDARPPLLFAAACLLLSGTTLPLLLLLQLQSDTGDQEHRQQQKAANVDVHYQRRPAGQPLTADLLLHFSATSSSRFPTPLTGTPSVVLFLLTLALICLVVVDCQAAPSSVLSPQHRRRHNNISSSIPKTTADNICALLPVLIYHHC